MFPIFFLGQEVIPVIDSIFHASVVGPLSLYRFFLAMRPMMLGKPALTWEVDAFLQHFKFDDLQAAIRDQSSMTLGAFSVKELQDDARSKVNTNLLFQPACAVSALNGYPGFLCRPFCSFHFTLSGFEPFHTRDTDY